MPAVAQLGSVSSHGGALIPPVAKSVLTEDMPTAHVGTMHVCPIPKHPPTPVLKGSSSVFVEDKPIATVGSVTGCGAVVVKGASAVEAG